MKAWLTPDSEQLEEQSVCRTISVPIALFPFVSGALELLAQEQNWEIYGTATPEEMSQYFMDVVDNYQESDCGMKFINQTTVTLFSETYTYTSGYKIQITPALLPSYAAGASALFCNFYVQVENAGENIEIKDLAGRARQLIRIPSTTIQRISVTMPMSNGGAEVSITGTTGESIFWQCNLIGWW